MGIVDVSRACWKPSPGMDAIRAPIADGGLDVEVLGDDPPARLVGGLPGRSADGPDEIAVVAAMGLSLHT